MKKILRSLSLYKYIYIYIYLYTYICMYGIRMYKVQLLILRVTFVLVNHSFEKWSAAGLVHVWSRQPGGSGIPPVQSRGAPWEMERDKVNLGTTTHQTHQTMPQRLRCRPLAPSGLHASVSSCNMWLNDYSHYSSQTSSIAGPWLDHRCRTPPPTGSHALSPTLQNPAGSK